MRIRQALALIFVLALCGAAAASSASAKTSTSAKTPVTVCAAGTVSTAAKPCSATPPCAAGQTTSATHPCNTAAQQAAVNAQANAAKPVDPIAIDPGNTGERQGRGDAVTIFRYLDIPKGLYQLDVTNTSGLGYINTFTWVVPDGLTVTAITSSEGGKCHLDSGNISCTAGGKGIDPPKCTCLGGGHLLVNFTATGLSPTYNGSYYTYHGIVGGWLHIQSMTPVPYHIPSFLQQQVDLPLCKKGQTSTQAKPCATS